MMKKPELDERDIKRHSDTVDDIVIFSYGNKNCPKASNPTYPYEYHYFASCEQNLEILLFIIPKLCKYNIEVKHLMKITNCCYYHMHIKLLNFATW